MKNNEEKTQKNQKMTRREEKKKRNTKKQEKKTTKSLKESKLNSDHIKYKWTKCPGKRERFESGFKAI